MWRFIVKGRASAILIRAAAHFYVMSQNKKMKKSEFHKLIDLGLKPELCELGFVEVNLNGCMKPEVLFNKGKIWFGASWDYRDMYLEISLGHLYWFKDVMPRVIILGGYASYNGKISSFPTNGFDDLKNIIVFIKETFEDSIAIYNERYDQILHKYLQPKK